MFYKELLVRSIPTVRIMGLPNLRQNILWAGEGGPAETY